MKYNYCVCFLSFFFLFMFSLFNFFLLMFFLMNNMVLMLEWEIITLNSCSIVMSILLDWMSLLFLMFVSLISSVVIYYSKSYMSSELNLMRFIMLVLMFVFSMILLIISPNMISILLGWDGLGLVSYCLVIYYQNLKSYNAGMLTALSNRIGDVLILMVISWMMNYGSWNFIFYLEFMKNDYSMIFISLMVILAAMTKSAQIPFSSWLPAAMAAPTPVSSLVHSSTLVTAGVYLLIRFNSLLVDTYFLKILLLLSSLTMFMAGLSANYEFDLKKIIALSTLSQLGLMMSILSMGLPTLAFFHLLTHAMFKALLFMCAGVIIHMMNDMQDIRYMGGISLYVPMTCLCFNISNMSLCGIPFLSGFYSKDMILEMMSFSNFNFIIFMLYYISTGLTMFYSIRLMMYLMINDFNLLSIYNLYDEDYLMLKSMFVLLFMSVVSGSTLMWLIFYYPWFNNFILMTWQKITPMILLSYYFNKNLLIFSIILSIVIGSLGGLNQTSLRKILAFSSINNLGWMISSIMISENLWMFYLFMYSFLTMIMIYFFYMMNLYFINQLFILNLKSLIKINLLINFLSLGGLPPFIGFFPKWIIINFLMLNNYYLLTFIFIMMSLIMLFFYIRIIYSSFMLNYFKMKWFKIKIKNNFFSWLNSFSVFSALGIILSTFFFM